MSQKSESLFYLIMIMAMTLWAGSWVSGKLLAATVHADLILAWRFFFCVLGFLAMKPFIPYSLTVPRRILPALIVAGGMMIIYNYCFILGTRYGLAHIGGVTVTTLNPVFTFLIAALIFRAPAQRIQILGIFLGVLGGLLLVRPWEHSLSEMAQSGNLYFIGAAISWAVLTHLAGRILKNGVGLFTYNLYLYLVSFLVCLLLILDNRPLNFAQYSTGFWLNIVYLSIFSSSIASTLYFFSTKRIGTGRAASFTLLVPAIAVVLSWLILGEVPLPLTLVGGAFALSAVYLINRGRRQTVRS
jgi:drug/metabolite transporter (DMT)-like permease